MSTVRVWFSMDTPSVLCTARLLYLRQLPHRNIVRVVVRSDVLLNPEHGRPGIGAERPPILVIIYSNIYLV